MDEKKLKTFEKNKKSSYDLNNRLKCENVYSFSWGTKYSHHILEARNRLLPSSRSIASLSFHSQKIKLEC